MSTLGRWHTSTGTAVKSVCVCKLIVERQRQRQQKNGHRLEEQQQKNYKCKRGKIGSIRFGDYILCVFLFLLTLLNSTRLVFVFAQIHLKFVFFLVRFSLFIFAHCCSLIYFRSISPLLLSNFLFFAPSSSLNIEYHSTAVIIRMRGWSFTSLSIVARTHEWHP